MTQTCSLLRALSGAARVGGWGEEDCSMSSSEIACLAVEDDAVDEDAASTCPQGQINKSREES